MRAQDDSPKATTRRSVQLNTVDIAGAVIGGDFTGRAYYRLPNLRIVHVHQHFYPGEVHQPGPSSPTPGGAAAGTNDEQVRHLRPAQEPDAPQFTQPAAQDEGLPS
ncbi:MAG: hypothetical protein V7637_2933 [Mycobacteriales bacterium]